MKFYKPLWHEGLILAPQHFQQQEQWLSFGQRRLAELALVEPWGISEVDIDEEALATGRLKLTRLKLRLPDGTLVDSATSDLLPPARDVARGVPAHVAQVVVSAALPLLGADGLNCSFDDVALMRPRRYFREFVTVQDHHGTGTDEIAVERLALRLMFDFEEQADAVACPVARLVRNMRGEFQLDPAFVPPCLVLSAHNRHGERVQRLSDILTAKAASLQARRRERSDGETAEFGTSDVQLFWLLHCIHAHWPDIAFFQSHPAQPPERLYGVLARLAGSLLTFSKDVELDDLPPYDHQRQDEVFAALETLIRDLLNAVIPSRVVQIALTSKSKTLWTGPLADPRLLEGADYYLSVHSSLAGFQVNEKVPGYCKIGAPGHVEAITNMATGGIPLKPVQRVPAAIPIRFDNHYFALDASHPDFERMLKAQACAIYLPTSVLDASVELYAVLTS